MAAEVEREGLSIGVLVLTIVAMVLSRRSEKSMNVLLCAAGSAFGAVVLRTAVVVRTHLGMAAYSRSTRIAAAAFAALAILLLAVSWVPWKKNRPGGFAWLALAAALLPLWTAGLWTAVTWDSGPLSPALALSMAIAWAFYQQEAADEQERRAAEIERHQAALLQEQIRPHFSFNALSAIQNYCRTDPERAAYGLENLSGYLRKNMDALSSSDLIPFEKELEHIEQYVALEKLNPLTTFEVIYELEELDFLLPALTIQPLVENAIHHGVRLKSDGIVSVCTQRYGKTVRITVSDNGPGFPAEMTQAQKARISHGLNNVRTRLETRCGGMLRIHSCPEGTRTVVLIPENRRSDHVPDPDGRR